ncbi:MAG: hypothetical protein K2L97_05195 [Muribaculaceae bacterium]|nr:hypothetical protein [Muribaculaceae bacterium]
MTLPAKILKLIIIPLLTFILTLVSCSEKTDPATALSDAEQALADGYNDQAVELCNRLLATDSATLTEDQLGRMALIYLKVAEADNSDEHIADATQCVRRAWKLSSDSMRGFVSTLSTEEIPQFVMLTRISGYIDFPPDLSEEEFPEDSIH